MTVTTEGRLTEEAIELMRRRVGIPQHSSRRPHNEWVTYDGIRHFAVGNGDTNPLWSDRNYASGTPVGRRDCSAAVRNGLWERRGD